MPPGLGLVSALVDCGFSGGEVVDGFSDSLKH